MLNVTLDEESHKLYCRKVFRELLSIVLLLNQLKSQLYYIS